MTTDDSNAIMSVLRHPLSRTGVFSYLRQAFPEDYRPSGMGFAHIKTREHTAFVQAQAVTLLVFSACLFSRCFRPVFTGW